MCRSFKASETRGSRPAASHPVADCGCSRAQPRRACTSTTSRSRSIAPPCLGASQEFSSRRRRNNDSSTCPAGMTTPEGSTAATAAPIWASDSYAPIGLVVAPVGELPQVCTPCAMLMVTCVPSGVVQVQAGRAGLPPRGTAPWPACRRRRRRRPAGSPGPLEHNPDLDTIDITGHDVAATRKYRNIAANPQAACPRSRRRPAALPAPLRHGPRNRTGAGLRARGKGRGPRTWTAPPTPLVPTTPRLNRASGRYRV